MYTSALWINDYLDPPLPAEQQADLLTRAGFPLEGSEPVVEVKDVRQDFEMTSNRGDCVCHVGLAREIAAIDGRRLKLPDPRPAATGRSAAEVLTVRNLEPRRCPLYTARLIRGVTIGPSPKWLQQRLIARGDIPRNNVVDVTNFVLFELGQPTHVFDLAKLKGPEIVVRMARPDEPFLPIGEEAKPVRLTTDDLVIADAEDAVAIAGVKGGTLSAVTERTTDVVIEAATFDPVAVRTTSRRHGISSDSSYRFERGVHPGQVEHAAQRVAELILDLAGGELAEGVLAEGGPMPEQRTVSMRPTRCRKLLGVPIEDDRMLDALQRLGFEPQRRGDRIHCTVPIYRLDVEREIDLIEEVGRVYGHDQIPVAESLAIRVAPPQPEEMARRAVHDALVGMGYVETITHSLIAESAARPFLPEDADELRVAFDRAGAEPVLRPSLVPSLLNVRALNRRNGVRQLKLFEAAATFQRRDGQKQERVMLTMVADSDRHGSGLRELRGAIERIAELLRGAETRVDVRPESGAAWLAPGATVSIDREPIGRMGLINEHITRQFDLDDPVVVAELELPRLYSDYPPDTTAHALPAFPAIERDVSAIVSDSVAWADVHAAMDPLSLQHLEAIEFITTYRGKPIGGDRKSLTFRCRFRAPDRTLQHEEVDPQMQRVIETLTETLAAEIQVVSERGGAPATDARLEGLTISAVLDAISARQPAPGGGAVASLTAALGAALGRMVLSYSIGRRSLSEHDDHHQVARTRLEELSLQSLELAARDAEASARMIDLWKLPADDPRRLAEWDDALRDAIETPHQVLETCREITAVAEGLVGITNHLLRSDLAIAAILAEAAARAAVWNVEVNLPQLEDDDRSKVVREQVDASLAEVRQRCERIERGCKE